MTLFYVFVPRLKLVAVTFLLVPHPRRGGSGRRHGRPVDAVVLATCCGIRFGPAGRHQIVVLTMDGDFRCAGDGASQSGCHGGDSGGRWTRCGCGCGRCCYCSMNVRMKAPYPQCGCRRRRRRRLSRCRRGCCGCCCCRRGRAWCRCPRRRHYPRVPATGVVCLRLFPCTLLLLLSLSLLLGLAPVHWSCVTRLRTLSHYESLALLSSTPPPSHPTSPASLHNDVARLLEPGGLILGHLIKLM